MNFDIPFFLTIGTLVCGAAYAANKLYYTKTIEGRSKNKYVNSAASYFGVLAFILVLRSFIVEPFYIPSASMEPGLIEGDYIAVSKFQYGLRLPVIGTTIIPTGEPAHGDPIVFIPPHDSRYFIKRVIGVAGDTIKYESKVLSINGEVVKKIQYGDTSYSALLSRFSQSDFDIQELVGANYRAKEEWTVPEGHLFVMGDNRDNSSDSRFFGFVPLEAVVGKAEFKWVYWKEFFSLPKFFRVGSIH